MASLTREAAKINKLSTCEYSVADPGEGPGGPAPPHWFLDQTDAAPPHPRVWWKQAPTSPPPIPGSGESKPLPPRPPSQGLVKASPYLPPPIPGSGESKPLPPLPPIWRSGSATSIGYFILTTMLSIYILLCSSRYSDIWKIIPWSLLDIDQN